MSTPAAWHPDPTGRHDHRWWDGQKWTEHVADAGQASVDPLDAGPAADAGTAEVAGGWASGNATGRGEATGAGAAGGTDAGASGAQDTSAAGGGNAGAWSTPGGDTAPTDARPAAAGQPPQQTQPQQSWDQPGAGQPPGQWGQPAGQQPAGQWGGQQGWPQSGAPAPAAPAGSDGVAIAAMIVGILSLLISFLVIPAVGGIIAIVLGFVARGRIKTSGQGGHGMAITGIVTGILSIVVAALVVVAIGAFWGTAGGVVTSYIECLDETDGDTELCDQRLEEGLIERFG